MSTIAENIANIRARMNEAAKKAGRDPSEILLCAATKMNDADRVKEAVAAGVDCCGENRVQEIQAKRPLGAYTGKPLHFIGHLQTNKVKYLVGVVDLIESVDRLELLECIEKQAEKTGGNALTKAVSAVKAWLYEGVNTDSQPVSGTLVKVETGIQNDDSVEILSGVSEGDVVLYTASSTSTSSSMMMGMSMMSMGGGSGGSRGGNGGMGGGPGGF